MLFHYFLKENGYNWKLARETLYNLNDYQINWLSTIFENRVKDSKKATSKDNKTWGKNNKRVLSKFDLRRDD